MDDGTTTVRFRVQGLGFIVQGLKFRARDLEGGAQLAGDGVLRGRLLADEGQLLLHLQLRPRPLPPRFPGRPDCLPEHQDLGFRGEGLGVLKPSRFPRY